MIASEESPLQNKMNNCLIPKTNTKTIKKAIIMGYSPDYENIAF
jgi:hypothetical protein